jgi:hypothetical protein
MDRDDLTIIEAARAQGANLHKSADGKWIVGLTTATDPLAVSNPRQADAFVGGGMIRLESGRTLKMEITDAEAREQFGLDAAR